MDSFRNGKVGKRLSMEDVSEDLGVAFLRGELGPAEFGNDVAHRLTPRIRLLGVDSG
jgi:hypothetical protein